MSGHVDGPFDPQKKMEDALRFYASERSWLNHREIRGFPGFHGCQIAANALAALQGVVLVDLHDATEWLREETAWYAGLRGSEDKREGYALGFYEAADALERRFGGNERSEDETR